MNKIKKLMIEAPKKMCIPIYVSTAMSKAFELIYDYEANEKSNEFRRLGNSIQNCKDRLDPIFSQVDFAIEKYSGNKAAAEEFKSLLLLASTPEESEQEIICVETEIYVDLLTAGEAKEIGVRGFWSE